MCPLAAARGLSCPVQPSIMKGFVATSPEQQRDTPTCQKRSCQGGMVLSKNLSTPEDGGSEHSKIPPLPCLASAMNHRFIPWFSATLLLTGTSMLSCLPSRAQVALSVQVGQPGYYGQINIGRSDGPQLVYPSPVTAYPQAWSQWRQPIYMLVPSFQVSNWGGYCNLYNACNRPVYFVREDWYRGRQGPLAWREDEWSERREHHHDRLSNGDDWRFHAWNRDDGWRPGYRGYRPGGFPPEGPYLPGRAWGERY